MTTPRASGNLLLGLKFREQLPQVIQDELDNIIAAVQAQVGGFGRYHSVPLGDLSMRGSGITKWTLSNVSSQGGRVQYATFGTLLFVNICLPQTTVNGAVGSVYLKIPGNYQLPVDLNVTTPCIVYNNAANTFTRAEFVVDSRPYTGNKRYEIAIIRLDGTGFSTTANDTDVYGQLIMPYERI